MGLCESGAELRELHKQAASHFRVELPWEEALAAKAAADLLWMAFCDHKYECVMCRANLPATIPA